MTNNHNLKLLEIVIDPTIEMIPHVPASYPFQKMLPKLEDKNFSSLESL